jgi:hypothetical protein
VIALGTHGGEQRLIGAIGAREGDVVAHLVDVAAFPAEVGLHVDDHQRRVGRPQVAVEGPSIGIGSDGGHR